MINCQQAEGLAEDLLGTLFFLCRNDREETYRIYKREAISGRELSRVASGNSIIGSCGKRSFK